jgi:hypothetical protein
MSIDDLVAVKRAALTTLLEQACRAAAEGRLSDSETLLATARRRQTEIMLMTGTVVRMAPTPGKP